jgi:hypothetical protein
MADTVTELRPKDARAKAKDATNAERQRRYRERKRNVTAAADVTPQRNAAPGRSLVVIEPADIAVHHPVTPTPSRSIPIVTPHRSSASLTILAYGLALVGLGINGWFAWNRGATPIDKALFASTSAYVAARAEGGGTLRCRPFRHGGGAAR